MPRRFTPIALAAFLCAVAAGATDVSNSVAGFVSNASGTLPYRLFEPTSIAAGQKVPLILFLHGLGDGGTDDVGQTYWMSSLQQQTKSDPYAAYVLAPQFATGLWPASDTSTPTNAETLTVAAVRQAIQTAPANIDTSRIYVTGVSMGSFETYDLLSKDPGVFAAAVRMSGAPDPEIAPTLTSTPIWAFHAADDPVVPEAFSSAMVNAVDALGGNAKLTELASGGHYIWPVIYADTALYSWTFAQELGENTSVAVSNPVFVPEPASLELIITGALMLKRHRPTRQLQAM